MTAGQEDGGTERRSEPTAADGDDSSRFGTDPGPPRPPRAMTDGGQSAVEQDEQKSDETEASDGSDESDAGGAEDESADESADDESAEESADDEEKSTDESEEESPDETESESEDSTDEAEDEADEEDEAEEGADEEDEAEEGADEEDEYHVEDAEDVYEDDEASGVLHLDLDGLFLDLLGLEVNLNPVTLDVSARPGENNLLGNLLSTVTGLLDGPSAVMDRVKSLLGKPKELLVGLASSIKERLAGLLGKPREWASGLTEDLGPDVGLGIGGDDGESGEDEGTSDGGVLRSIGSWLRSLPSAIGGWLKERLASLVPSLPIEELVATVVREIARELIEQLEPDEEPTDEAEADAESQAEAGS
ncbi:hypothetical protein [Natrarchaeobius oligotrophus]|nr:hypothetical protein [Natrarchaeobius chitinivorans]